MSDLSIDPVVRPAKDPGHLPVRPAASGGPLPLCSGSLVLFWRPEASSQHSGRFPGPGEDGPGS